MPRNHIRYISWAAYLVQRQPRRDSSGGHSPSHLGLLSASSLQPVRHSPHSNFYLQDGIDMGVIMDTDVPVAEVSSGRCPANQFPLARTGGSRYVSGALISSVCLLARSCLGALAGRKWRRANIVSVSASASVSGPTSGRPLPADR